MDSTTPGPSYILRPTAPREGETDIQREKREKAAERQRRKRERDKAVQLGYMVAPYNTKGSPDGSGEPLTPEEALRRDKVRAAARERQRKHRALVKQKKMRDLGYDMGNNEGMPPGLDSQLIVGDVPAYGGVLPPGITLAGPLVEPEPPFPPGQQPGGQTFASTLLLSFSCAPLLKQHLLRTLNMTNEELASFEPILADAWDQWDQQRRMQFEHRTVPGGPSAPFPVELSQQHDQLPVAVNTQPPHPFIAGAVAGPANEFRARFHRPLVAPIPFQTPQPAVTPETAATPPAEAIDPNLGGSTSSSTASSSA